MNRPAFLLGVLAVFAANVAAVALRAFAEAAFLGAYGPGELPLYLVSQAAAFAADDQTPRDLARRWRRGPSLALVAALRSRAAAALSSAAVAAVRGSARGGRAVVGRQPRAVEPGRGERGGA
ncbi:MAG: hypothetical protein R3B06_12075 [Kofleriaceae bacterium]